MPHKPQNTQNLKKSFNHMRSNYQEKPKKSFYLWGRKKGADLIASEAFRENFDRIFGKPVEPGDFDEPTEKGKR
jgi:hypothetical protein